jgi:hypothetical protein
MVYTPKLKKRRISQPKQNPETHDCHLPLLPDNLVDSILFDYLQPGSNVALTTKTNYKRIKKEMDLLKKETKKQVKSIISSIRSKHRIASYFEQPCYLTDAIEAAIIVNKNIARLSELCPKGHIYNAWLPIRSLKTMYNSLMTFKEKWLEYISDTLKGNNIRGRTESFMQVYETYELLSSTFEFCDLKYVISRGDYNIICNNYTNMDADYLYNYNMYLSHGIDINDMPDIIDIIKNVDHIVLTYNDYLVESNELSFGDIGLDDILLTIDDIKDKHSKFRLACDKTRLRSEKMYQYVYDILQKELYDYVDDYREMEQVHDLYGFFDPDDLLFYFENDYQRKKFEYWYLIESLLTGFTLDSYFLTKMKLLSKPGHLLHYIDI